jgi:predicted nucleic acid-binding protein
VNVYAESSAILAWLLGEEAGDSVRDALASAGLVLTSDLTLVECDRVLHRAAVVGELTEAEAARRRAFVSEAAEHWVVLAIDREVVERARRPFPQEPIRTLDAIHLATALLGRSLVTEMQVLTLDKRVRANAGGLGFDVVPEG